MLFSVYLLHRDPLRPAGVANTNAELERQMLVQFLHGQHCDFRALNAVLLPDSATSFRPCDLPMHRKQGADLKRLVDGDACSKRRHSFLRIKSDKIRVYLIPSSSWTRLV